MQMAKDNQVVPMEEDNAADIQEAMDSEEGDDEIESNFEPLVENFFLRDLRDFWESMTYDCFKASTRWCLDSSSLTVTVSFEDLMMYMTLFVLFADDIKILAGPKSSDGPVEICNSICLFFFIFELIAATWSKSQLISWQPFEVQGYFGTFFFYLDIISILSMLPDITWIANPLGMGGISNSVSGENANLTKAGRVVRLVRLVRLIRLFKLMSARRQRQLEMAELQKLADLGVLVDTEEAAKQSALYDERQSKLGSQLSDRTTRKIIVLILTLLIILPLITVSTSNTAPFFATELLHEFNENSITNPLDAGTALQSYINEMRNFQGDKYLLKLTMTPYTSDTGVDYTGSIDYLRENSKLVVEHSSTDSLGNVFVTEAIFNGNPTSRQNALYGIIMTIVVGLLLVIGSYVVTQDAQRLVLDPIERMMNMVEAVAEDPLKPLHFKHGKGESGQYETMLLETTIEKITGLLRVGFGEAGAGIISSNLSLGSSSVINALLPGLRVYALLGFCDIHHFEDVNWKLGGDVLTFVNTICEIVHSNVHSWGGQCNKNLGNAFVIVWRIGDEAALTALTQAASVVKVAHRESQAKKKAHAIDLRKVAGVDTMADKAMIGYLKIIAEINRSKEVLDYRREPRLTDNGASEFKVRMGFGLHAGWAIEGAVGSIQKVDATYLSPHVNMAARLETSSRQYGVPMLASQNFYELMSVEGQSRCRRLDVVTVKGSEFPIGIYTYDAFQDQVFAKVPAGRIRRAESVADENQINSAMRHKHEGTTSAGKLPGLSAVEPNSPATVPAGPKSPAIQTPQASYPGSEAAHKIRSEPHFIAPDHDPSEALEQDADLLMLRCHVDDAFLHTFKEGVDYYLDGKWKDAKGPFMKCNEIMAQMPGCTGDGPSQTLLRYMDSFNFIPPETWDGYRPLTAK